MAQKIVGFVSSDKADKTITVKVISRETHPIYGKKYTVSRKYAAHDEKNAAHIGDMVQISEIRPVSKTKSWTLDKVIETGHGEVELKDEEAV